MSRFSANYGSAVGSLMHLHGRTAAVTITPPGTEAVPVELTAICTPERIDEQDKEQGRTRRRVRECQITTDPDGTYGGMAEVSDRSIVTIDAVDYAIEAETGIVHQSDHFIRMKLVRIGSVEHARQDYRRK